MTAISLRTVNATRYVTPLREGGSLPAIIEADDDGLYVLKFKGAGQGRKALIAELLAGEIGRSLGLPVPEIVLVNLDPVLGATEPDPEIQDLIKASGGLNLALDYLPGSIMFDPVTEKVNSRLASEIVWFDAFVTNVDRTARNTNMLMWHKKLWLIDHGAALYFHHRWENYLLRSQARFEHIRDHVLLPLAEHLDEVDEIYRGRLSEKTIRQIVDLIPTEWLGDETDFANESEQKNAYHDYLISRLQGSHNFVEEAKDARAKVV